MENLFVLYAYLSAGIMAIDLYHTLFKNQEDNELMEELEIFADTLNIDVRWLIVLAFLFVITFGWLFLPIVIINRIFKGDKE